MTTGIVDRLEIIQIQNHHGCQTGLLPLGQVFCYAAAGGVFIEQFGQRIPLRPFLQVEGGTLDHIDVGDHTHDSHRSPLFVRLGSRPNTVPDIFALAVRNAHFHAHIPQPLAHRLHRIPHPRKIIRVKIVCLGDLLAKPLPKRGIPKLFLPFRGTDHNIRTQVPFKYDGLALINNALIPVYHCLQMLSPGCQFHDHLYPPANSRGSVGLQSHISNPECKRPLFPFSIVFRRNQRNHRDFPLQTPLAFGHQGLKRLFLFRRDICQHRCDIVEVFF